MVFFIDIIHMYILYIGVGQTFYARGWMCFCYFLDAHISTLEGNVAQN
jgi:hypothetical protein